MDTTPVYVLVELSLNSKGEVLRRNVGVTFNIHDAETHQAKGVECEYDTLNVESNWREDAENTALIFACREFRGMVTELQEQAIR